MATERDCFFAKPKAMLRKGCKKPAKYRVIIGGGMTIDVCEEHSKGYRGIGLKLIELSTAEVEA